MLNHVRLFVTLWTIAFQAPLSMEFSKQEYWSGLLCPPPGDLPDSGTELVSHMSFALRWILYRWATRESPYTHCYCCCYVASVIFNSVRPPQQPTRLLCPWDSPGRILEWVAISFSNAWKWSHWVMSNSQWPHGLQPTRLLCPWDFPGKSTGVGCHCLLLIRKLGVSKLILYKIDTRSTSRD